MRSPSKTTTSVIVSVLFTIVVTIGLPWSIPKSWLHVPRVLAVTALILACAAWLLVHIQRLRPLRARREGVHPMIVVLVACIGAAIAVGLYLTTRPEAEASLPSTQNGRIGAGGRRSEPILDPEARYIRDSILSLVYELRQTSGRQFRDECILMPGEQLGPERPPMELLALTPEGRFTVVQSLQPLATAFAGVYGGFMFQQNPPEIGGRSIKPGYQRVFEEYHSLLGRRWVIAAVRYRDGQPLTGNETFNTCLYGLRNVAEDALETLLAALDDAEARLNERIAESLSGPRVPEFRIDLLHEKLQQANLPFSGLSSPRQQPTPENDAGPTEYFPLSDGRYLRAILRAGLTLTDEERRTAETIIRDHERNLRPSIVRRAGRALGLVE